METIALSEAAIAVLRFRIRGYRMPLTEKRLSAFRELADAGIMEPVPGPVAEFRFTAMSAERRQEILSQSEIRLARARHVIPGNVTLSDAAREMLRTCIDGRIPDGDETNRPSFRELVAANIMMPIGTFARGDDCVFRFTYAGWERRYEFAGMDRVAETA
jgi:hypothetical protein